MNEKSYVRTADKMVEILLSVTNVSCLIRLSYDLPTKKKMMKEDRRPQYGNRMISFFTEKLGSGKYQDSQNDLIWQFLNEYIITYRNGNLIY